MRFVEIPGVKERSGQLLVRPIQESAWTGKGLSESGAAACSNAARRALALTELSVLPDTDIHVVPVPQGETEESLSEQLMGTGLFEFAEPNWIVYPARTDVGSIPDDPGFASQWHLNRIQAPSAWNTSTGDSSLIIAFVDTGIDLTHPDLAPLLVPGCNAVTHQTQNSGGLVADINGHGTEVAGAAAAMGNNAVGGSGVCWSTRIMPVRASNSPSGSAYMSDVLYGASWGAVWGARVVSVSYAGVDSPAVEPTAQAIIGYGSLLLWAAGNVNTNLPGDYPSLTVVGSTDQNDNRAADSNYGRAIDVMAPGVGIYVPTNGGGYGYVSGTSFATPIAAGVLALAWSAAPTMSPQQAMDVLYRTCDPIEPVSEGNNTGWGRVNAFGALQAALGRVLPREPQTIKGLATRESFATGLAATFYSAAGATQIPLFRGDGLAAAIVPQIYFPAPTGSNPYPFWGCPLTMGFGTRIQGYMKIGRPGVYTFTLSSRDGSRLYIDGQPLVNHDGVYPTSFRSGSISLGAGLHTVHCDYFSSTSAPTLILNVRGCGMGDGIAAPQMFYHPSRWDAQSR